MRLLFSSTAPRKTGLRDIEHSVIINQQKSFQSKHLQHSKDKRFFYFSPTSHNPSHLRKSTFKSCPIFFKRVDLILLVFQKKGNWKLHNQQLHRHTKGVGLPVDYL